MSFRNARRYANLHFVILYLSAERDRYIEYCKEVRDGEHPDDQDNHLHLKQLDLYERTERGDFDHWPTDNATVEEIIKYAVRTDRCDVIERYAPHLPDNPLWNYYVSFHYTPFLYTALSSVMPLPVGLGDAVCYVSHGLHNEVALHIVGRRCRLTGEVITLRSIALKLCASYNSSQPLSALEGVGLDLSDPELLYVASLSTFTPDSTITLLRARCERSGTLDAVMPDGKTLREMLDRP